MQILMLKGKEGSALVIAMFVVVLLVSLAIAVMEPVGTAQYTVSETYNWRVASIAADSVAERIKAIMCQDGAEAADGCSPCISATGWVAPKAYGANNFVDQPGVTFPTLDMRDNNGSLVFDSCNEQQSRRPDVIGYGDSQVKYIAYSIDDANGSATSYVSAEYEGTVVNLRVSYHRQLGSEEIHPSYLHAVYAANDYTSNFYTYLMEQKSWPSNKALWRNNESAYQKTGVPASIRIMKDKTIGYLGYAFPSDAVPVQGKPFQLYAYVKNVPNGANITASIRDVTNYVNDCLGPYNNVNEYYARFGKTTTINDFSTQTQGNVLGTINFTGHNNPIGEWICVDMDPQFIADHRGSTGYISFQCETTNMDAAEPHVQFSPPPDGRLLLCSPYNSYGKSDGSDVNGKITSTSYAYKAGTDEGGYGGSDICVFPEKTQGYVAFKVAGGLDFAGTRHAMLSYCEQTATADYSQVSIRDISNYAGNKNEISNAALKDCPKIASTFLTQKSGDGNQWFSYENDYIKNYAGNTLYITFCYEKSYHTTYYESDPKKVKDNTTPVIISNDTLKGDGGGGYLTYVQQAKLTDTITGDIFIDGAANIKDGIVNGTTKATGVVTGNASSESDKLKSGYCNIDAPDLSKTGAWYKGLKLNTDGSSTSENVITDSTDGHKDETIAGFIKNARGFTTAGYQDEMTRRYNLVPDGTTVYMFDTTNPIRNRSTGNQAMITVPAEYNNKAIYVHGDLWMDVLAPRVVDFSDSSAQPKAVNLTFIVEGNVYMPDSINLGKYQTHPDYTWRTDTVKYLEDPGIISVIAIKDVAREANDPKKRSTGNISYGDPSSQGKLDPISAFLYAENDFKWNAEATTSGNFNILGNMTAGGRVDFTNRCPNGEYWKFMPITLSVNPKIFDPDIKGKLPMLPDDNSNTIIPGSPFSSAGRMYL